MKKKRDLETLAYPEGETETETEAIQAAPRYVAQTGLNYGVTENSPGIRLEPGDSVPASVVEASPWLIEAGHVRKVKGGGNG